MFPFELLFNDNIPKTNIQIQNITFNKSKLFRNYKKLNMFLYDFSTFENNIYKLDKFRVSSYSPNNYVYTNGENYNVKKYY